MLRQGKNTEKEHPAENDTATTNYEKYEYL
jgi:hypothetical protein